MRVMVEFEEGRLDGGARRRNSDGNSRAGQVSRSHISSRHRKKKMLPVPPQSPSVLLIASTAGLIWAAAFKHPLAGIPHEHCHCPQTPSPPTTMASTATSPTCTVSCCTHSTRRLHHVLSRCSPAVRHSRDNASCSRAAHRRLLVLLRASPRQPQQPIEEGANTGALPRLNLGNRSPPNSTLAHHHLRRGHARLAAQHYRTECLRIRNIAPNLDWPCGQSLTSCCVLFVGSTTHRCDPSDMHRVRTMQALLLRRSHAPFSLPV